MTIHVEDASDYINNPDNNRDDGYNRYKPAQKNYYPKDRAQSGEFKHRGVNIFEGVESIHKKTVSAWNQNPSYGNHFGIMSIAFALSLIAQAVLQGAGMIARAIDRT